MKLRIQNSRRTVAGISARVFPFGKQVLCFAAFALLMAASLRVSAQQSTVQGSSAATIIPAAASEDTRYRIGAGDVLNVVVRKAPELSGPVRVDQRGLIRLPMIDGDVPAACRTESELSSQIATLYLEYKKNPSVEVFVTEFQSRPVAVIGAVNSPGQFRLQRQVRLLELLSFASGPSPGAGRVINIIHTGGPNLCAKEGESSSAPVGMGILRLNDTLAGKEDANPFVQPGDIVSLPEADQVFVIGHVNQPRSIALKDKQITVSRAVAMAGGAARDGETSRVKIIRESSAGEKQEILVDLHAIQKQRAMDVILAPNDVVEVGTSTTKQILGVLTGAAPAALSNGVIRAIP